MHSAGFSASLMVFFSYSDLTWGGGGGGQVFRDYYYAIPPVLDDKLQAQAIPRARGPQTSREGGGAPLFCPRESHIIDLRLVLCLTDRQLVPVYFQLRSVHATMVCRH